jgi:hypothetical protein
MAPSRPRFHGRHITYNLPEMLERRSRRVALMSVDASPADLESPFALDFSPIYWRPGFEQLRYGLGNFYSLEGEINHYHNWYDRAGGAGARIAPDSTAEYSADGGFPFAWLQVCSGRFLREWEATAVKLPGISVNRRERALAKS